jgi:hypothetical protein
MAVLWSCDGYKFGQKRIQQNSKGAAARRNEFYSDIKPNWKIRRFRRTTVP